ncbi:alpha/beta fold hydrolase [Volucribacter amazonae]|uniref:Acyl-CoA esterase n=1 Tax=Volucribacter amazonae TaxID=256731 RepID=A0A9X4P8C0_9PAST|nr:alpha/beta fold hydrolase [Volucribacter amazonae]MDG6894363.1 acyl-CoA esterase [Volucribacter amazonae]
MNEQALHYQYQQGSPHQPTLVFLHGLFGDMNNLGIIAKGFSEQYNILRLDLRNHGQSFHSEQMNYPLMAQDIYQLLEKLQLKKVSLIGHSMGGKTAMQFTAQYPEQVEKLVVIDIAPIKYQQQRHQDVFAGLFAVKQAQVSTRQQARPLLAQHIKDESIIQFMLKSFDPSSSEKFRFNLTALYQHYSALMDWQPCLVQQPTLFIKGGKSDYIQLKDRETILAQFPQAQSFTINGADHWVHAEKPTQVIKSIERFLSI